MIPLSPLFLHSLKKIGLGFIFFILFYTFAPEQIKHIEGNGSGIFYIRDIQEQKGALFIRGTLQYFENTIFNTNASIRINKKDEARISYHRYLLFTGSIKNDRIYPKLVKPNSYSTLSAPWIRFYAKKNLLSTMEKRNPNGAILSSLLFGSPVPKKIAASIKRFGLSHLFAISGFHFNLVTTLLTLLIRPFVSHRFFHWTIFSLLTLYAILIGPNPSLLRGFLAQAILFLGLAIGKHSIGLNSLGVALFLITLFFPHLISNIGFIFSFTITFALLLIFPLVSQYLFPKKPAWLMAPLALLFTVELASFPLNLTLFGSYPLLSPLYNLIVTPLISFALFLAPLSLIPYLSSLTMLPLDLALMTFDVPTSADIFIRYDLSAGLLISYLTALFTVAIFLNLKKPLFNAAEFVIR